MLADGGKESWSGGEGKETRMDIKRVRVVVRGSVASQSYVTQPSISSGQLGTNQGDSHGHTHSHMNTTDTNVISHPVAMATVGSC